MPNDLVAPRADTVRLGPADLDRSQHPADSRPTGSRLAAWCLAVLLALLSWPPSARGDGPWTAQVVDAETAAPLEGVVVLMYWVRHTASLAGWVDAKFHDSKEVVTGPDGRFAVPAHSTFTPLPWHRIAREMVVYKPGYGQWRFRGEASWPRDAYAYRHLSERAWQEFQTTGAVIELPPLKTREERLAHYSRSGVSPLVPTDRAVRLRALEREERTYLGFEPSPRSQP